MQKSNPHIYLYLDPTKPWIKQGELKTVNWVKEFLGVEQLNSTNKNHYLEADRLAALKEIFHKHIKATIIEHDKLDFSEYEEAINEGFKVFIRKIVFEGRQLFLYTVLEATDELLACCLNIYSMLEEALNENYPLKIYLAEDVNDAPEGIMDLLYAKFGIK